MVGRGANGVDSPGASALKSRVDQGPKASRNTGNGFCSSQLVARMVWRSVGLSLGKSLSLNTSALQLKEKTCVLPRLSPTELSQSDSGVLRVQPLLFKSQW